MKQHEYEQSAAFKERTFVCGDPYSAITVTFLNQLRCSAGFEQTWSETAHDLYNWRMAKYADGELFYYQGTISKIDGRFLKEPM